MTSYFQSWESKIVATGVADFDGAAPVPPRRARQTETSRQEERPNGEVSVKTEDELKSMEPSNKVARTNGAFDVRGGDASHTLAPPGTVAPSNISPSALMNGPVEGSDSSNKRKRPASDDNEIGSDLDDSDEDEMEGNVDADGNEDMILCLYDKVQRVRSKWKCVLKDGVASIDGRDYVFSKLASELEW